MLNFILLQYGGERLSDNFYFRIFIGIVVLYIFFFIHLYIFRAIFKIPSFLKYQKAQVRLLEELAKTQGVEASKVQNIISETYGWEGAPQSTATNATQDQ